MIKGHKLAEKGFFYDKKIISVYAPYLCFSGMFRSGFCTAPPRQADSRRGLM